MQVRLEEERSRLEAEAQAAQATQQRLDAQAVQLAQQRISVRLSCKYARLCIQPLVQSAARNRLTVHTGR